MSRKRKRNSGYDGSVYRSLVLVTQFGINMLVPIGMMSALGIWLDGRFHTSFWTIVLFFVGAIAGGQNVWRMAKSVYEPDHTFKGRSTQGDAGNARRNRTQGDAGVVQRDDSTQADAGAAQRDNTQAGAARGSGTQKDAGAVRGNIAQKDDT